MVISKFQAYATHIFIQGDGLDCTANKYIANRPACLLARDGYGARPAHAQI